MRTASLVLVLALLLLGSACGDDGPVEPATTAATAAEAAAPGDGGQMFPDVIDATIESDGASGWTVRATISSPYDTPQRYADAWRVLDGEGTVLAVRDLAHDHAAEQPFTRALSGVEIPDGVTTVTIEGRDRANGWGGATFDLDVPAS